MRPRPQEGLVRSLLLLPLLATVVPGPTQQASTANDNLGQYPVAAASAFGTVDMVHSQPVQRQEIPNRAVSVEGLIGLNATVTDADGKALAGLQQGDFKILDNGTPQKIVAFRTSESVPHADQDSLSIVIFLDTLDLTPDQSAVERHLVAQFLRLNAGKLHHQTLIYTLDDAGFSLAARSSTDGQSLAADIESGKRDGAYFLAPRNHLHVKAEVEPAFDTFPAMVGLRALGTIATDQARLPGQKLLFWIGPGLGTRGTGAFALDGTGLLRRGSRGEAPGYLTSGKEGSTVRKELFEKICWFSQLLRQARVTLDCVAAPNENAANGERHGDDSISRSPQNANWMDLFKSTLALNSGGRVLSSLDDLAESMSNAVGNAEVFYSFTFDPPPASDADEYHSLRVEMRQPGLSVHTSAGYFDQPFYSSTAAPTRRTIAVSQLQAIVQTGSSAVKELTEVELTERLSEKNLATLLADNHDKKLHDALLRLAAESSFLKLPPGEALFGEPPDPAERNRILKASAEYVDQAIRTFPSFAAIRNTTYYQESVPYPKPGARMVSEPLRVEQQWQESIRYRGGQELVEATPSLTDNTKQDLKSYGTFGPVLALLQSMAKSTEGFAWTHWERGTAGRIAVFHYSSAEPPMLTLSGCCYPNGGDNSRIAIAANWEGEIAVDPTTGVVLRLEVKSELPGFVPAIRSDTMISYGPVKMGGKTYVVPQCSVSIWRGRSSAALFQWNVNFLAWGPYETKMNVFTFDHYHLFHGEARLLPGVEQVPKTENDQPQ